MEMINRLPIPTPFRIGQVNCYSIAKDSLTLIDPGPATEDAYESLEESLSRVNYTISDVACVLITHPHVDHYGLTRQIVDDSGARVIAHEDAAERLANPIGYLEKEREYFRSFLLSMGMPPDTVDAALELSDQHTGSLDPVAVTNTVTDGDTIDVGVELECLSTPGHSAGSLCYNAHSKSVVFTGDHILPDTTPNPLLTLSPDSERQRTRSLPIYLESLHRINVAEAAVGYGGHGDPILDLQNRVQEIISHHDNRKERIGDIVAEKGPLTAYEIMNVIFTDLPESRMFPGMSEVIGHLDLLEDEQRVEVTQFENHIQYLNAK